MSLSTSSTSASDMKSITRPISSVTTSAPTSSTRRRRSSGGTSGENGDSSSGKTWGSRTGGSGPNPRCETTQLHELDHERGQRHRLEGVAVDVDGAGLDLHADARAAPGGGDGVRAGEREQPQVDAVALKDPCEALRDHAADSGGAHRSRHVLARRPRAEVGARDEDRV